MPTYRMTIEYDGSDFHGWQIQARKRTVQAALQDALTTALRYSVAVVGSGRTDAGVHARGQVAHFTTTEAVDEHRLLASLNGILPRTVAVRNLRRERDDFHARYDARLRRYHYYISTGFRALERHIRWHVRPKPDFEMMTRASFSLLGEHDFASFCRTQSETINHICHVRRAAWIAEHDGDWHFEIAADRFLHGMVRGIVGTLVEIGHGKRSMEDIPRIMSLCDRREAGPAAPAHGLVLEDVCYEGNEK